MTRADLLLINTNTEFESGTASNAAQQGDTETLKTEVWYQQYNRRTHGYDEQRSRQLLCAHE